MAWRDGYAIFDIYFNSADTASNKAIDQFALKFEKKNPGAFYLDMDENLRKIHRQQGRKLDFNLFVPFMLNFVDETTTTLSLEAELFFKLFTAKKLHSFREIKKGFRLKIDLLDANYSQETHDLVRQALRILDKQWGLMSITSKNMDERTADANGPGEYISFTMARQLIDLIDIFIDLETVGHRPKKDPMLKDYALEWKPRILRLMNELLEAQPEEVNHVWKELQDAIAQFKYFYKSEKLNILYDLFAGHIKETEAEKVSNKRALVAYSSHLPLNQDGKTLFDSLVEFIQANRDRPEVVKTIHQALIKEAKGEFKSWRYESRDYQRMFEVWLKQQGDSKSQEDKPLSEEEKGIFNSRIAQIKSEWEQNRYFVVKGENGENYYLGFTDNFSTLVNLGNPADFGSCQACYKPSYNRGLGGYVANGWNKALVIFDEKGKFVARRIVRLRLTEEGEFILLREHTYGNGAQDQLMDQMLNIVAASMDVRYQSNQGETAETTSFHLWRGHSEWDYSDSYGKQFDEPVGLIRIQGDIELNASFVGPLMKAEAKLIPDGFKPESEEYFKLVADKIQSSQSLQATMAIIETSIPRADFVEVGTQLYFRGVPVTNVAHSQLQELINATRLDDINTTRFGAIYVGQEGRLYRETIPQVDSALLSSNNSGDETPGGIDLNPTQMDLQEQGQTNRFNIPIDPAMLQNFSIEGAYPVIINITPIPNLQILLGLDASNQSAESLAVSSLN